LFVAVSGEGEKQVLVLFQFRPDSGQVVHLR
jgi:hypothetical protein